MPPPLAQPCLLWFHVPPTAASVIAWDNQLFSTAAFRTPIMLDVVTTLAEAHVVCGSGCSEWEDLSKRVAVCPLQLTEKAMWAHRTSLT